MTGKHAAGKRMTERTMETVSLCAVCAAMVGIAIIVGMQGADASGISAIGQEPPTQIVDKAASPEPEPDHEWTYGEPTYEAPAYDYWSDPSIWGNDPADYTGGGVSGGLTASSGVNYYNGTRETYYSSNVLYHYRTPEWTVDDAGFYRTSEGYYVVASSDYPQGTVIDTSQGQAQVLDSGCASGTVDFYTQW